MGKMWYNIVLSGYLDICFNNGGNEQTGFDYRDLRSVKDRKGGVGQQG